MSLAIVALAVNLVFVVAVRDEEKSIAVQIDDGRRDRRAALRVGEGDAKRGSLDRHLRRAATESTPSSSSIASKGSPASTSQTCRTPAFAYVGTLHVRSTFRVDSERAATAMEPQSAIVTRNTSSVVVRPSSTLLMPLMRRLVIPFLIAAFLSSCVGEPWRTISFKLSLKRMTS